jgi:uncharacterized protein with PQ loop repeat
VERALETVFAALPLVAAVLAVPQFLPQLIKVRRAGSMAGVSWSWAALTAVSNGGWLAYFTMSQLWTGLVPAVAACVLSGWLAAVLAQRLGGMPVRPALLALAWAGVLVATTVAFGRVGLGSAMAVAFTVQMTPPVLTVYRSADTSGVALGTWWMIFGELTCWGVFGLHEHDSRLIVLGATGVVASLLVIGRVAVARRRALPEPIMVTA